MPIVDEYQSGVRRYAIFTFVVDNQGGLPGSPALRFPQSPHSSSLEVSTRLRHCESFFMKRLRSLEKGLTLPFADVTFFSSYQNLEEMKRLLEPADCINFHDASITLQKGCYEEVQLVDPKRDMIQTPIDDDYDDEEKGSGSGSDTKMKRKQTVNPPGIQTGVDDYKKTRGYILITYKTMEYMYSREFLTSWKTWTGVRYICMQIPRQLGLRRIAFYPQTLNLMDRMKLRLCGYAGIYREMDFQVDPVTAGVHHIPTTYRPPPPDPPSTIVARLNSVGSCGSIPVQSRKASQAVASNGEASGNVDSLMQLLKQQQEAVARRKATMEMPPRKEKRHSLAPPDYPAPSAPNETKANELKKEPKKAPTALPESEESETNASRESGESKMRTLEKTRPAVTQSRPLVTQGYFQPVVTQGQSRPVVNQVPLRAQQPVYHSTTALHPVETSTAASSPIPHPNPSFVHYHHSGTLPMQHSVYGQILSHPMDALLQTRHPLEDMIASDYHPLYTYTGKPVVTSPFGFVQPTVQRNPSDLSMYNSPVYTRNEWMKESAAYAGHVTGDESMRTLAEKFRTLKETPIIGSEPYLPTSGDRVDGREQHGQKMEGTMDTPHRKRSQSAVTIEYNVQNSQYVAQLQDQCRHVDSDGEYKRAKKAGRLLKQIKQAEKNEAIEREKLQEEADKLQKQIMEAERKQKERIQRQLAEEEEMKQKMESKLESAQRTEFTSSQHRRREREEEPVERYNVCPPKVVTSEPPKTSSPKRRLLPKLPPHAIDSPDNDPTSKSKKEEKIPTEKDSAALQQVMSTGDNGKDTERRERKHRRRSKDVTEKAPPEQAPSLQKVEPARRNGEGKTKKGTSDEGADKRPSPAGRRPSTAERKSSIADQRSSAATDHKSTGVERRPVNPLPGAVPSHGHRERRHSKDNVISRSRSRENGKDRHAVPKAQLTSDGPSTSTQTHLMVQPVHEQPIVRSRSGSRRRRQSSRRRK